MSISRGGLDRGLARLELVDIRCALQHTRIGRLAIGRGREDAVDVAMVTTYGAASLRRMIVWADEVSDDAELTAGSLVLEAPGGR